MVWLVLATVAYLFLFLIDWAGGSFLTEWVSVSAWLPQAIEGWSTLPGVGGIPALTWAVNFLPFVLPTTLAVAAVAVFLAALFFIDPQRTPLEDSTPISSLLDVKVRPHLNHLADFLYVIPGTDAGKIIDSLVADGVRLHQAASPSPREFGAVSAEAPAS